MDDRRRASILPGSIVWIVWIVSSVLTVSGAAACAASRPPPPREAPLVIDAQPRIVTDKDAFTVSELAARAEGALLDQRWSEAAEAYRLLFAADPAGPHASEYLLGRGLALEGAQDRAGARDVFVDLARRFPQATQARTALVRAASLDAYLEEWPALATIGDTLLARSDLDPIERLVGLGSRGLARVESGDDTRASQDIHEGLDLGDQLHYGDRDVLPVAVAQLRFALGELRRTRSERIRFDPVPDDFIEALDERCAGLLEAQAAYAQAVRSVDPHWAAMAGYRVGAMYRTLHTDLMRVPPPRSKTERQRQIFYAFMHVRYRVLLEKGLREIEQTLALGERTRDSSAWIERAKTAKDEMQAALDAERAALAQMPFTEGEIQAALELLKKKNQH